MEQKHTTLEGSMDTEEEISVLMLPWLAHGHISPFLCLAKALSKKNLSIYLCSTPVNLNSIKTKLTHTHYSVSIKLVEIHLPTLPNLPPHYHTTNGLPPHLMSTLKKAFDMAKPTFSTILKTLKPTIVIYDFLQPWAPEVASTCNIPAVLFLPTAASSFYYIFNLARNPLFKCPFPAIYVRGYEHEKVLSIVDRTSAENEMSDPDRIAGCIEGSNGIILIKTFREIEGKYVDAVSTCLGIKMVPVGPLVQEDDDEGEGEGEGQSLEIIEWLNNKEKASTVFVSFGSESFLSKEEIEEMGHGLELSNVNFIWVVRFPVGEKIRVEEALPKGFFERVGERGKVVEGWATQKRILRHQSIGGFVSHCGWSSVMEGMKMGVPIIPMPIHLDQPFNARLVEELGVGEEIVRGGDGSLEREEVCRVIRKVVLEKSGEEIRRKVKQVSKILIDKGEEEIDWVVQELEKLCKKEITSPTNSIST